MSKIAFLIIGLFNCIVPVVEADTFTSAKVTPKFDEERGLIAIVANTSLSLLHLQKLEVTLDGGVMPECTFLSNQAIQLGAGERAEVNVASPASVHACLNKSESAIPLAPMKGLRMVPMPGAAIVTEPSDEIARRFPKQIITINGTWLHRESPRQSQHYWILRHE